MVHTCTSFWLGKSPGEVSNTAMMSIAGASGIWGGVGHEEEMEEWWLRWWYGEEGTIIGTGLDKEGPSVDEEGPSVDEVAAWFRAQAEPAGQVSWSLIRPFWRRIFFFFSISEFRRFEF